MIALLKVLIILISSVNKHYYQTSPSIFILIINNCRHSPAMIDKLKTAGLGYSVGENETQDRFGRYLGWLVLLAR